MREVKYVKMSILSRDWVNVRQCETQYAIACGADEGWGYWSIRLTEERGRELGAVMNVSSSHTCSTTCPAHSCPAHSVIAVAVHYAAQVIAPELVNSR